MNVGAGSPCPLLFYLGVKFHHLGKEIGNYFFLSVNLTIFPLFFLHYAKKSISKKKKKNHC